MGNSSTLYIYLLLVFCKVDMEVLSLFIFLSIIYSTILHYIFYKSWDNSGLWVIGIYIKEVFVV